MDPVGRGAGRADDRPVRRNHADRRLRIAAGRARGRILEGAIADKLREESAIVAVVDLLGHQTVEARRDRGTGSTEINFEPGRRRLHNLKTAQA